MKHGPVWLWTMVLLAASSVEAKVASLSMVYTNALGEDLPFSIFSKHEWSPAPAARFVKLHLYFDEPIMVKALEILDCGSKLKPNLSVFFNFDQWVLQTDPDLSGRVPDALYPRRKGNSLVLDGFENAIEVRSLTFNFENNSDFKICGIHLMDPNGGSYTIKTPDLVAGTVEASSVLEPRTAYNPIFLFDSRFEYGWASDKQSKNVDLTFKFDQPKRIEKIRIWNGYQRSVTHCYSNSRPKTVRLTGDDGYQAEISIKDMLGSQVINLPTPFAGTRLKFSILDSFLGKSYKDLVISEIRFFDGKNWFLLDPTAALKEAIALNRARFAEAKADALLNDSYTADEKLEEEPYQLASKLRLRADGSFFISGVLGEEKAYQYFALGNYEIKEVYGSKGLKLRLFGLYYESEAYGDCNGCGRDCNKNATEEDGTAQKIFQEFITIKPGKNGKYSVTNESGGKKLKFKNLVLSREVVRK